MRVVIQRVSEARVVVDGETAGEIQRGYLLLIGVGEDDGAEDIEWLARKICGLRLFPDGEGRMNRSLVDVGGEILAISQFTLHASCKKGTRPSFTRAGEPTKAQGLYADFCAALETATSKKVERGIFGADMQVSLINDGPVTIWLDSKNRDY